MDSVDLFEIDERLKSLDGQLQNSASHKKSKTLIIRLENFLSKLPSKPSLSEVLPHDLRRFLVWSDTLGKTQVHGHTCPYIGRKGIQSCACRIALSFNTLSVLVSQLVNVFDSYGRGRQWDEVVSHGNPAASRLIKQYVKMVNEEQAKARILPKQAKPLFMGKIRSISSYIENQMKSGEILTLRERYTLARDQAVFKLQFFAGDRASDISNLLVQEIRELPDKRGYAFCHTFGKTLRGGDGKSNTFVIMRCPEKLICPIQALESYFSCAKAWGVELLTGYVFRTVTESGRVLNAPITYSVIYERLKTYLNLLGINEGETPHSLRAGCAISLAVSKSGTVNDIKQHIGWSSDKMADYYSRATRLRDASTVATTLARSVENNGTEDFYQNYGDFANLKSPFL